MATSVTTRVTTSAAALLLLAAVVHGASPEASDFAASSVSGALDGLSRERSMAARAHSTQGGGFVASAPILPFDVRRKRGPQETSVGTATESHAARNGCPVRVVRKAQRGNKRAFAKLWKRYAPAVNSILLTMVQEPDADDLTQEVAVTALRALPSLKKPESFPSWLTTIARNMGRDALKAKRASKDAPITEALDVAAPAGGDSTEADEIIGEIRNLPECHREPLMLRLLLEMSGPEIAEQTGMTEGSVRVNLCRGMKLLRHRLQHWDLQHWEEK